MFLTSWAKRLSLLPFYQDHLLPARKDVFESHRPCRRPPAVASLESRSPHDNACVAPAVSLTSWPSLPMPSFNSTSANTRSFVGRRQRSLTDLVLSWSSSAFRFKSKVITRCIQESSAVIEIPNEAFTAAFHFVLTTGLVLMSLCNLVHRCTFVGVEQVTLTIFDFQIRPCFFKKCGIHDCKVAKGRIVLIEVVYFIVGLCVLFLCRAETPLLAASLLAPRVSRQLHPV